MTPADAQRLFQQATHLHRQGQLAQAETIYRQLVAGFPNSAEPRHFLGILCLQQGRLPEALTLLDAAVRLNPRNPETLANRAMLHVNAGRPRDAAADLKQVVALQPGAVEVWNNLGNVLSSLGEVDEALAAFDRALALKPDFVSALYNRANLLREGLGRLADAVQAYDTVLAREPGLAKGWTNRGNALRELGRLDDAIASYDRALALEPTQPEALTGRAQSLFELGRVMDGMEAFAQATALLHAAPQTDASAAPHKARHDQERTAYLESIGGGTAAALGAKLDGPAVKPDNRVAQISDSWRTGTPQLVVIDDFLTPPALTAMRRFCLETPSWRVTYPDGYLGAMPLTGFACPLLGQIAEELAVVFPAIFGGHPLQYMWGFKYDSQLRGTALHADEAAVNVNFWITPDDACLDPDSGGLVVWDVVAPLEWDFAKMNGDNAAIRAFMTANGAKPIRVPHRQNRAVIFDSDLFHETDTIRFKEGYMNRRINVTMLFGRRGRLAR